MKSRPVGRLFYVSLSQKSEGIFGKLYVSEYADAACSVGGSWL
jgi:hypothetical protein